MTKLEMEEALQLYYESLDIPDYYETVLKNKTEKEIKEMYQEVFEKGKIEVLDSKEE